MGSKILDNPTSISAQNALVQIKFLGHFHAMKNIDWIRQGLKEPGKNQKSLAEALHITQPQVSRLLKGHRRLKADEIDVIANYLGVAPPNGAVDGQVSFPDDNTEAAIMVAEYILERTDRPISPSEKVKIVADFRRVIEKARHG